MLKAQDSKMFIRNRARSIKAAHKKGTIKMSDIKHAVKSVKRERERIDSIINKMDALLGTKR